MKWVCRLFVGGLLFACSSNNHHGAPAQSPSAPQPPSAAQREDACRARAGQRADAKRAAMADAGVKSSSIIGGHDLFESLYERLLDCAGDDPNPDSCIIMQAHVSRAGTVSSEPYVNEGVPDDVIRCLADVLRTARFPEQQGDDASGLLQISFTPRRRSR